MKNDVIIRAISAYVIYCGLCRARNLKTTNINFRLMISRSEGKDGEREGEIGNREGKYLIVRPWKFTSWQLPVIVNPPFEQSSKTTFLYQFLIGKFLIDKDTCYTVHIQFNIKDIVQINVVGCGTSGICGHKICSLNYMSNFCF
jgi:hypothetical protein